MTVWDAYQRQQMPTQRPAGTVESVATRDERRHGRHTKRARTTQLGQTQRRLLVALLNAAKNRWKASTLGPTDTYIGWRPSKSPLDGFEPRDASKLSTNVRLLASRGLVKLRQHEGGKVHAVALTEAGLEMAVFLDAFGESPAERRKRIRELLPRALVAYVPQAFRELRSSGLPDRRRLDLRAFTTMYRYWLDILEDRVDDPGIETIEFVHRTLVTLHRQLTSSGTRPGSE